MKFHYFFIAPLILWFWNAFNDLFVHQSFSITRLLSISAPASSALSKNEWTLFTSLIFTDGFSLFHAMMTSLALYVTARFFFLLFPGGRAWFLFVLGNMMTNQMGFTSGLTPFLAASTAYVSLRIGNHTPQSFLTYFLTCSFLTYSLRPDAASLIIGITCGLVFGIIERVLETKSLTVAGKVRTIYDPLKHAGNFYKVWKNSKTRKAA